jgi:hypothetical protein
MLLLEPKRIDLGFPNNRLDRLRFFGVILVVNDECIRHNIVFIHMLDLLLG